MRQRSFDCRKIDADQEYIGEVHQYSVLNSELLIHHGEQEHAPEHQPKQHDTNGALEPAFGCNLAALTLFRTTFI